MQKKTLQSIAILCFLVITNHATLAQPSLWGMTSKGNDQYGVIFKTDADGNNQTIVHTFDGSIGTNPYYTHLCLATNGKFYGMTTGGGANFGGVLFEYDRVANEYKTLHSFNSTDGSYPVGSVFQATNGRLYGMTNQGGANGQGVIFEYDISTNLYTKLYDFDNEGSSPYGNLIQASNGKLYGMTHSGGLNNDGVIFAYDLNTSSYNKLHDFEYSTDGSSPYGSLLQAMNGKLYGMTYSGGVNSGGTIFEFDTSNNTTTKLYDLDISDGAYPYGSLMQATNGKLYGMTGFGGSNNSGVLFEFTSSSNTYSNVHNFNSADGDSPFGDLTQATNGKLYGMTQAGGSNNKGVVFEFNLPGNVYTKLYDFNTSDGSSPYGNVIQGDNGLLYGLTNAGGTEGAGVLFEFNLADNIPTTLINFGAKLNGGIPNGSLLLASNNKLYGTTSYSGMYDGGVLFEFDMNTNTYTTVHDFFEGVNPLGDLIEASNGKLYGTTSQGGTYNYGVLFEFNCSSSSYTVLHNFNSADGTSPKGSLIQAKDGKLYGMTNDGGANNLGVIFKFDISTNTYTAIYDFDASQGSHPIGSLMQATNGKLYGMTSDGGATAFGVIFEFDLNSNTYTDLHDFDEDDGSYPNGGLIQARNGKLYGTAQGGINSNGVIFEFDIPGNIYTKLYELNSTDGTSPTGNLLQARNNKLYGMTQSGGTNNYGVFFEFNTTGNVYTKKADFIESNGRYPQFGSLIEVCIPTRKTLSVSTCNNFISPSGKYTWTTSGIYLDTIPNTVGCDSLITINLTIKSLSICSNISSASHKRKLTGLWGMTAEGGDQSGVIFKTDGNGNNQSIVHEFSGTSGSAPIDGLCLAQNGKLYGTTRDSGTNNTGVLFELDVNQNTYIELHDFEVVSGTTPRGSLIQGTNGKLYGLANEGGANNFGVLFQYDINTNTYSDLYDFGITGGKYPSESLLQASNGKLYGMTIEGGATGGGVIFEFDINNKSYTKLHDFTNTDGDDAWGHLIQASNKKLYGITSQGGVNNYGVIFEFDIVNNSYTKLYDFDFATGVGPFGSLVQAKNNKLYGMTLGGGENSLGTIFEFDINTAAFTKIHDFDDDNGAFPKGSLIQAGNGNLYGMTRKGGTESWGVLFELDLVGNKFTKKIDFVGKNGKLPEYGNLIEICFASTSTISPTTCDQYVSPSGKYTWTTSGTYMDTIPNTIGCDSIMTIHLLIKHKTSSVTSITACNSYTWNTHVYSSSGSYVVTIPNSVGCDSIITLHLTINKSTSSSTHVSTCSNYVWNGNTYITSGTYSSTIRNSVGCDSVMTLYLTINKSSSSTTAISACDSLIWNGKTYSTTGTYSLTIPNKSGCDSVMTLALTIKTVDTSVVLLLSGTSLISGASTGIYQWMDCDTNKPIAGETRQDFNPTVSGRYGLMITQNGCTGTSECFSIVTTGILENTFGTGINIFPNPTNGNVVIDLGQLCNHVSVSIRNIFNQEISATDFEQSDKLNLNIDGVSGFYFIIIKSTEGKSAILKIMKTN